MKYKWFESTYSLFLAYEALALEYKNRNAPKEAFSPEHTSGPLAARPSKNFSNYNYTLALVNINAAIIEGTLRSILVEIVAKDVEQRTRQGKNSGQSKRTPQENLLNKFYMEIDSSGGWDKLKEHYSTYLGISIDRSLTPSTKEAMGALFLLRNIFAHGTALVHPSEKVPDEMKDEPIFKWQSRVQAATIYLEKQFGHADVFDNLAEFDVPKHFFEKSKNFLSEIFPVIQHPSERARKTIEAVQKYSWGFRSTV